MRIAAIVFLLANIALFAWQYQERVAADARAAVSHQPLPSNATPLKLLSELPELPPLKTPGPEADSPPVTAEVQADVTGADVCINAGPLSDSAARDRLRDWLRSYTAALYMRVETVRKGQFFWVYLEPSVDGSAEQHLAELHDRGVQDTLVIRRGELKNAISLGLFRSQDSVNRRLAELTDKGYQPVVVPKFETTDQFWISARLAEQYTELPAVPTEVIAAAHIEAVDCAHMRTGNAEARTTHRPLVEGLTN